MSSDTFGLELSFRLVSEAVKRKDDVLVVIVHWFLSKFGFRCIGVGDNKSLSGNENGSELLPSGWSDSETYSLRYLFASELYILRGVRADDTLIFNLLHTADLTVSNLAVDVSEVVVGTTGSVESMVPSLISLIERIRKELAEPVTKRISSEATTQTTSDSHPTRVQAHVREPERRDPLGPFGGTPLGGVPLGGAHADPFNYGRSDLDPLGGVGIGGPSRGGGMLFDPLRGGRGMLPPGGLPRGRVPGARFDPIFPPVPGRGGRGFDPDPDHLPPPGYDDMFM